MAAIAGKNVENPADWRTAVDATSGRTYWYHRKTRISTWECPFERLNTDNSSDIPSISISNQGAVYPQSEFSRHTLEQGQNQGQQGIEKPHVSMQQQGSRKAQRQEPEQLMNLKGTRKDSMSSMDSIVDLDIRELVQCMAHVVRAGGTGTSIFSLPIQLHSMMIAEDATIRDNYMLLVPPSVWSDLIDALVALILKEEGDVKQHQQLVNRRRAALQSFWLLSLFSAAIATVSATATTSEDLQKTRLSTCFQANRSWLQLLSVALPAARLSPSQPSCVLDSWWRQNDRESVMLLCGALSCLAAQSSTAELIPDRNKISLAGFLYNQLLSLSGPRQETQAALDLQHFFLVGEIGQVRDDRQGGMGLGILDKGPLRFLTSLAVDKGQSLPALLLLLLGHDLIRPASAARSADATSAWLRSGGLGALQCMSICSQLDEDIVSAAKGLLASAMELSAAARDMLLESYLSLAADLGRGAIPIGPSPDLRVRVAGGGGRRRQQKAQGQEEEEEEADEGQDEKEEEDDGDSAAQFLTELDLEELEQRLDEMRRDVEWIPSVGAPWRVSSVLLWSRCPELRELINHYWERDESGRGGLEIRLGIPGHVMGCICRYLQTGIYTPPCHMADLLQLLKASKELGMLALTALASSDVCKEIKSSNLALVMRFAEDSEDQDLSAACNHFLALQAGNLTSQGRGRGQAYEEPASRAAGLGSQSVADSRPSGQGQGQGRGQGRSTIAASSLREAVQTSIVDVNRALQTVYPNTMNPSSLGLGQGTRHDSLRKQDLSQRTNDLDVRSARPLEDVGSSEDEDGDGLGGPHSHLDEEGDEDDFFMGQNLAQGKPYLKPRSGGIYSLLLKAQGGSGAATSPVQSSLGSSASRKQATVPALAPADGGGVGRAAALLAAAGPRDPSSRDSSNGSRERRGSSSNTKREAPMGQAAIEFNRKMMSLEPSKDKDNKHKDKDKDTAKSAGSAKSSSGAAAAAAAPATTVRRVSSSSSSTTASNTVALNAPKRAQSPQEKDAPHVVQSSRDAHTVQPQPPQPLVDESNVRGSLTLLKTKTRIKRRTAADIEEHEQQLQEAASAHLHESSRQSNFIASRAQQPTAPPAVHHAGHFESDSFRANSNRESVDSDNFDTGFADAGPSMLTCPSCGRHFNPTPFEKHVKICKKVFVQKRKVFDSSSMRSRGIPDLQEMMQSGAKGKKGKKAPSANLTQTPKPPDNKVWKQQSEAFREAIRAAREFKDYEQKKQDAMAFGGPLPPPPVAARPSAVDPSLIPCPHCERRFNQKAADRHIPQCQSIRAKPAALKKGSGGVAVSGRQSLGGSTNKNRGWQ